MRRQEQRLWDTMKRRAPGGWWLQRFENAVGVGMPDVYVVPGGAWVELKAPDRPMRADTALLGPQGLSQPQINWHLKAASYGIPTYILIRDSENALHLIEGRYAEEVNYWNVQQCDEMSVANHWEGIWEVLQ